jgi:hypothetical protein
MKIWIVFGSTGEYADREEWAVDAWRSEVEANARVEQLEKRYHELEAGLRKNPGSEEREAAMASMRELDPGFFFDRTGATWHVVEMELKP